ncbi:murein biosynthesis integral membrane protein MurJ [Fodinicola feengrottensis]|uniref:murein biosynthesis integral membrane protein MurJ n=1 Tax=Fodinicola feengrottensis TaxID=435914 RepID=UPI0013D3A76A|nr:lipid II flippase MurJ [Fodinicola feengrottensis]
MLGAVLNSRGKFAAPAWVPVLNNVVVIGTAAVFAVMHGGGALTISSLTVPEIVVLGAGTSLGIAVQAVALWIPMRRLGFRWKWRWDWRGTGLGETRSMAGWLMLYVVFSQIGLTMILRAAAGSGSADVGSTVYNNAFILFTLPHGLVAVSVITALLPRMSRAAVEGRLADITDDLSLGTRLSSTLLVPATAVALFFGPAVGVLLYAHGHTTVAQAQLTGQVFAIAAIGLVPYAISQIQTFVLYAMRDAKTAALINIPVVLVRVVGVLVLPLFNVGGFLLQALMIISTLSYVLAMVLGAVILRRRLGPLQLRRTFSAVGRIVLATAPAAALAVGVQWLVSSALPATMPEWIAAGIALLPALAVGGAAYVGFAFLLRVREIREVIAQVRRRVGR